ncbi:ribosomal protein L23 [Histomonas meleagridis]|uniref:ribosomal protein L23 n=1 Tax=Histomonas meleagridis TaxID=135588 RepID=UPI003559E81E|nr:ribosomal protein L23 [Histomonas meleagridis]KAH0802462.1 ribosomal protein L23 [Histomonas meleagridis]
MSGKAEAAAAAATKGQQKQIKKTRNFKKYQKPKATIPAKKPQYEHKAVQPVSLKRNDYKIIKGPVTSDKASRKLEDENTMTFYVDIRAKKPEIAAAINRLYHVKPVSVKTLITPKFLKKAYVRLPEEVEAMNLANEMA